MVCCLEYHWVVACIVVYAVSYHLLRDHYTMLIDPAVVKRKARH
jgi:hypothetical protein